MILEELKQITPVNGVLKFPGVDESFGKLYLQLRKKEKRIYSNDEIKLLPYASKRNPHKQEWAFKTESFLRFKKYLSQKKSGLNILDLGCGNGWLTGQLAKEFGHNYFCIDVNLAELEQAARVFKDDNIKFIYANIFTTTLPANTFDLVIINSALQYFNNINSLMKELFFISKPYVEIHIIDTPFYRTSELIHEKRKTLQYYHSIGFPDMANKYFHHSVDELKYLRYKYLYNPNSLKNIFSNFIFEKDSPCPWIVVTR